MESECRDIVLFQQGDVKAFDEIFYQYYPAVINFARKMTRNREAAEEIVMDSFKKLYNRKESFDNKSSIKAWLMITTKNACYNYLHAEKRKSENKKEFIDFQLNDPENNPSYSNSREDIVSKLHEEINRLPDQCRTIMKLRLEGYTNPQIGKILGISVFTVRNQVVIAFKKLKINLLNIEQLVIFIMLLRQLV